jgi:DNA-directed RNA polymerase sigma subunit (sigma70/sigma32)
VGPLLEFGELKPDESSGFYLCKDCHGLWSSIFEGATQVATRIEQFLSELSDKERAVVRLVHGLEDGYTHSFDEVGHLLGIPPEQVQAIEAEAMTKLRAKPA